MSVALTAPSVARPAAASASSIRDRPKSLIVFAAAFPADERARNVLAASVIWEKASAPVPSVTELAAIVRAANAVRVASAAWNALDAWVARSSVTPDQSPLWAYGEELYRSSCGTCHNLPPAEHTLANQWAGTLNAMKRFISIDEEEYRFLLKYLQFNAKDTGGKTHG